MSTRKGVPRRIGNEFAYDHSQPPASAGAHEQRRSFNDELDIQAVELRAADRAAQPAQISLGIDERVLIRRLQRAMDFRVIMQELRNAFEAILGLVIVRTR